MYNLKIDSPGFIQHQRETMSCSAGKWDTLKIRFGYYHAFSGKYRLSNDASLTCGFGWPTLVFCLGEKLVYDLGEGLIVPLEPGFARLVYAPSLKVSLPLTKSRQYHIFSIGFSASFLMHEDLRPLVLRELLRFEQKQETNLIKSAVDISDMSFRVHSTANVPKGEEKNLHIINSIEFIIGSILDYYEQEIRQQYFPNSDVKKRKKFHEEWEE
jgi:hypothetical protein